MRFPPIRNRLGKGLAAAGVLLLFGVLLRPWAVADDRLPRILFLGDLQCETTVASLDRLRGLCADADVVLVNLEGPLTPRSFAKLDKTWKMRSAPRLAEALARLRPRRVVGIVANNHAADCGAAGVDDTRRAMARAGLRTVGDAAWPPLDPIPLVLRIRGTEIAVLAANLVPPSRNAPAWPSDARVAWERRLAAQVADFKGREPVIVCLHWNPLETVLPSQDNRDFAHRLMDAGATVVAGYHPHVIGAMERTAHGLIVYSMGNLALSCPCSQQGEGVAVKFTVGGDADAIALMCGRRINGLRPTLARAGEAAEVRTWINTLSVDYATRVDRAGRIEFVEKKSEAPATGAP